LKKRLGAKKLIIITHEERKNCARDTYDDVDDGGAITYIINIVSRYIYICS